MKKKHQCCFKVSEKLSKYGPEIYLKSIKIQLWIPGVLSAAPKASQGSPKVPKWSPRVRKWSHQACQMIVLGTRMTAPAPKVTAF